MSSPPGELAGCSCIRSWSGFVKVRPLPSVLRFTYRMFSVLLTGRMAGMVPG